jgi:hypothetical protein
MTAIAIVMATPTATSASSRNSRRPGRLSALLCAGGRSVARVTCDVPSPFRRGSLSPGELPWAWWGGVRLESIAPECATNPLSRMGGGAHLWSARARSTIRSVNRWSGSRLVGCAAPRATAPVRGPVRQVAARTRYARQASPSSRCPRGMGSRAAAACEHRAARSRAAQVAAPRPASRSGALRR